jgi:uncharacterized protein YijF (DUF1287 family)
MLKRLDWLLILFTVGCGALLGGCLPGADGQNMRIPRIQSPHDQDGDGILDADDIVAGARCEVTNHTRYLNRYYEDGYPPDGVGVCTDVIWRAFKAAGYDLKALVDQDIRDNLAEYARVTTPNPNIDFRRVVNLNVFFRRNSQSLPVEIIPGDVTNLGKWQGGDLVVFNSHIVVISDRRRSDGVPYLIHNGGPYATEEDALMNWGAVVGHYRWVRE